MGADWLKRKAALYPQLSLIPTARLGCAVSLNCEETVAPWCGAELMSSEHWGGLRRRCHRREIVMVSCCVIAGMSSHWLKEPWLPRWGERRVLFWIGCWENFQTSRFLSQGLRNGDTVFHVCLPPLLAALWSPDHSPSHQEFLSVSLSLPAQKNSFTARTTTPSSNVAA